jgi:hypothetical protein
MAIPTGLSAQVGSIPEVTYGTRLASTRFLEMIDETFDLNIDRIESGAVRAGAQYLRSDRWAAGKRAPAGSISYELANTGFGLELKHCLGTVNTAQPSAGPDPTVYEHTLTAGDLSALSMTKQFGLTDIAGTTHVHEYVGCCVNGWELSQALDQTARLNVDYIARDSTEDGQTLATASYPTQTLFTAEDCILKIAGVAYDVKSLSLKGDNSLADSRYFTGSALRKHPISNKIRSLMLTVDSELNDLTQLTRIKAGGTCAVTIFWTGAVISHAYNYALEVTLPACRLDTGAPKFNGPDIVGQPLVFKCLDAGSGPISAVYRTTDATP